MVRVAHLERRAALVGEPDRGRPLGSRFEGANLSYANLKGG